MCACVICTIHHADDSVSCRLFRALYSHKARCLNQRECALYRNFIINIYQGGILNKHRVVIACTARRSLKRSMLRRSLSFTTDLAQLFMRPKHRKTPFELPEIQMETQAADCRPYLISILCGSYLKQNAFRSN